MKRIGFLATALLIISTAQAQNVVTYRQVEPLHFAIGDGIDQVGYREATEKDQNGSALGPYVGPYHFVISPLNGDIAILDYVKGCIKIFSKDTAFTASIDVEGNDPLLREIKYAPDGCLWFHLEPERYLKKYSSTGTHLRTITYYETHPGWMHGGLQTMTDSVIVMIDIRLTVDPSSRQIVNGEETYHSEMIRLDPSERKIASTGNVTGNYYEQGSSSVCRVHFPGGDVGEITLPPVTYYICEDGDGNSFFKRFFPRNSEEMSEIWIYNRQLENIAVIPLMRSSQDTWSHIRAGRVEITPDGSVYQMDVNQDGVTIYKWERE